MSEKSLIFVIKADITNFNKALGDADRNAKKNFGNIKKSLDEMSKGFAVASAMIIGSMGMAVGKFANLGDALSEASDRTGIAVEKLQTLNYMAIETGAGVEGLEVGIKKMQSTIDDLGQGSKEAGAKFARLGIVFKDLQGLTPDQQLMVIGDALRKITDAGTRSAIAVDIFGKSGTKLLSILLGGQAGLDAYTAKLKETGFVMSEDMVNAGNKLRDTVDLLKLGFDTLLAKIGEQVNLQKFVDKLIEMVSWMIKFIEQNPQVVQAVLAIGIALGVMAAVIKGINVALVIMNALQGPKGWIAMAAGIAIAAGSIALLNNMEPVKKSEIYEGKDVSDLSPETKKILGVPGYASGGIVSRPTLAMVGEAGPEAIIPLNGKNTGASLTISVGNFMGDELSLRQFTRTIKRVWEEENNRSSFAPTKTNLYSPGGHM